MVNVEDPWSLGHDSKDKYYKLAQMIPTCDLCTDQSDIIRVWNC